MVDQAVGGQHPQGGILDRWVGLPTVPGCHLSSPSVRLLPGGKEASSPFPSQEPHQAHRCSLPRARPASFRNSSCRNSMVAVPTRVPCQSPRPRARAAASGIPGSAPARPGPAAPLGGNQAESASCPGLLRDSTSGGGAGRGITPTQRGPTPCRQGPPSPSPVTWGLWAGRLGLLPCKLHSLSFKLSHPRASTWPSQGHALGTEL